MGRSGHTVFVVNSRGMNGLVFARDGRMLGCQGSAGALVEIDRTSKAIRPLAESVAIDGVETKLGRINDLAVDAEGGIYFTDPSLGRTPSPSPGLHYRAPSGEVRRVDATVPGPNGVAIAPDGKSLVVLSYKDPGIYAFEIRAPGDLGPARKIGDLRTSDGAAPKGRGDGLAIDAEGRLWCTNPDAKQIQIFSPDGRFLGSVQFPEAPANCAFGGSDGRTLFVTAVTSVYALPTLVEGWWIAREARKSDERAGDR
jgi:gluconolactonase